jgi:hypothetical protein
MMATGTILLIIFVFLFGVYLRLSKDNSDEESDHRKKYWAKYEDR